MLPQFTSENVARFWSHIEKQSNGCWIWRLLKDRKGYGRVNLPCEGGVGQPHLAHRVAWMLTNGSIPDGLCVLHNCPDGDNPACCNPTHLFLGTRLDNNRDMQAKGRSAIGRKNGTKTKPESRPRGESHWTRKRSSDGPYLLTEEQVKALRERFAKGDISRAQIARDFNISPTTAFQVINYLTWKDVE